MKYENIVTEIGNDFVASIMLNRPDKLNAFSISLATELNSALLELDEEKKVRVIIIKGSGKAFCAGADVSDFSGMDLRKCQMSTGYLRKPLITISQMKKPVIAQVHGVAAANGAGLVAAADLAIAAENARIGLTAINMGLNCICPVVPVARSIGRKQALDLLFSGDLITAEKALSMGLINRIVPEKDIEKETRKWAVMFAQKSPIALQLAKKAFYNAEDMNYLKAFEYMNAAFFQLCLTKDAEEGVRAFFEKRIPLWKEE